MPTGIAPGNEGTRQGSNAKFAAIAERTDAKFAEMADAHKELAREMKELAKAQKETERTLRAFIRRTA